MRIYFKLSLVAAAAIILSACATGPKVYINQDPNTDLGGFKTYGFEPQLGTDRGDGTQSLLSQFFINAAKQEMELRGYTYNPDNPDLGLNFYVSTKEKIRSTSSPTMGATYGGHYGYRGSAYGAYGGYETTVTQYTEGTVTIDLVNMSTDKLVWEGTAIGRISSDVEENLEEAVGAVVLEIFAKYPTQQGGGAAYKAPKK
jgi:hypothetical protein